MLDAQGMLLANRAAKRCGEKARQTILREHSHPLTRNAMGAAVWRACENPAWAASRAFEGGELPRITPGLEDYAAVAAEVALEWALTLHPTWPGTTTTVAYWQEMAAIAPGPSNVTLAEAYAALVDN